MLERYLLAWLLACSWLALQWPDTWPDPFAPGKAGLPWVIVVTMFAIGLMLPKDDVTNVLKRWPVVFGGTLIQYLTMPALAFLFALVCGLEGPFFVGLIMVGCVPGAMASNVLTLNARGNASYSVSLTTAATLVSPVAVPLALGLTLGAWRAEQVWILGKSAVFMIWTVVGPVICGHLAARVFSDWESAFRRVAPRVANLAILWIIFIIVGLNRSTLSDVTPSLLGALLLLNLGGYLAGHGGGRLLGLERPMRRALTLEVGMQNAGLGATLASHLFPDSPATAIAPAIYTFGCMLTGTALARLWSTRVGSADREPPRSATPA